MDINTKEEYFLSPVNKTKHTTLFEKSFETKSSNSTQSTQS